MVGQDIKDYYKLRKANVLLPMTYFSKFTCEGTSEGEFDIVLRAPGSSVTARWWRDTTFSCTNQWLIGEDDWKPYLPDTARYVQAAAAKIVDSSHDTLTFLAELHKTRAMFENVAKTLLKLLVSDIGTWKRIRNVGGAWLESRYGWRVLVYDIQELAVATAKLVEGQRSRFRESIGEDFSITDSTEGVVPFTHFDMKWFKTVTYEIGVRGSVVADIEVPPFSFDPLKTGWELITLSFVVDWFLTIGKALSSIAFRSMASNWYAAGGYAVTANCTLSAIAINTAKTGYLQSGYTLWQTAQCNASWEHRLPRGIPSLPQFNLNLNTWKGLDIIALIRARLK
jgi:hypothetical protein